MIIILSFSKSGRDSTLIQKLAEMSECKAISVHSSPLVLPPRVVDIREQDLWLFAPIANAFYFSLMQAPLGLACRNRK